MYPEVLIGILIAVVVLFYFKRKKKQTRTRNEEIFSLNKGQRLEISSGGTRVVSTDAASSRGIDTEESIDYLGKAAALMREVDDLVKDKKFDSAWGKLHEAQSQYLLHAKKWKFNKLSTLRIDGIAHKQMANILRMEGKHDDALVSFVYSIINGNEKTITGTKTCSAYFNRCKFSKTSFDEFSRMLDALYGKGTSFFAIRGLVSDLHEKEKGPV